MPSASCIVSQMLKWLLTDNMVGGRIHINAIGGGCPGKNKLHLEILARATTLVVSEPQTRIKGAIQ